MKRAITRLEPATETTASPVELKVGMMEGVPTFTDGNGNFFDEVVRSFDMPVSDNVPVSISDMPTDWVVMNADGIEWQNPFPGVWTHFITKEEINFVQSARRGVSVVYSFLFARRASQQRTRQKFLRQRVATEATYATIIDPKIRITRPV